MTSLFVSQRPRLGRRSRALLLGCSATALLVGAPAAQAKIYVGTPGPDHLKGKSISGDTLWGGGGADTLTGGPGPDKIYGVRSNNLIRGGAGDDYIEGGAGSDDIDLGSGNNTVFGSSGQDVITGGDGNNYVDVGGGNDKATVGNGNNVVVTGSGGGTFDLGDGNNTVYYGSGIAYITAGKGVNTFYLAGTAGLRSLKCGGNPDSVVYVNSASLKQFSLQIFTKRKAHGCAKITTYDGTKVIKAKIAGLWDPFAMDGTDGNDKLFGGHGGGTINSGEGDDILWADYNEDTGLPRSQDYTTTITAGNGNNQIYGGRGTNVITAGNGNNFVRAGAYANTIRVGSGENLIRLQGAASTNDVTITGAGTNDGSFVESLANGRAPSINCVGGAKAAIVYGNTKPNSNCRPMYAARSKQGKALQVVRTPGVPASTQIVDTELQPGDNGIGVARPVPAA